MSNKAVLSAISIFLLSLSPPAWSQQPQPGADFPEGPAKAIVVPMCGACHDINRLKAGYTPEGWRTVMRMMQNMDVPTPPIRLRR
jgi:virginiamycin B lyase